MKVAQRYPARVVPAHYATVAADWIVLAEVSGEGHATADGWAELAEVTLAW
ncbi:hypothetical protein VA596_33285 [Amycolatopsis sp., V23-08]|uniref:Uncharacterized protein n=1 Tax=Amycolatopsis heterodermiae TaxID=3110235 RepID=A0ABU5RH13_9PSEU|nr:hypothetical protein [Amycolatopsis sp., V23-08]MEA5364446.1 hypothetical protein [Amycolatopsis sp., V23-08]